MGGGQHSMRQLEDLAPIKKDENIHCCRTVDPVLAIWLHRQSEIRI
jgi:hypothetical protein